MAVVDFNITNNINNKAIISGFSYDENGTITVKEPVVSDSYCSQKGIILPKGQHHYDVRLYCCIHRDQRGTLWAMGST